MQFNVSVYGMNAKQPKTTHTTLHNILVILMHAGGTIGLVSCGHSEISHFEKVGYVDLMATGKQTISFGQIQ